MACRSYRRSCRLRVQMVCPFLTLVTQCVHHLCILVLHSGLARHGSLHCTLRTEDEKPARQGRARDRVVQGRSCAAVRAAKLTIRRPHHPVGLAAEAPPLALSYHLERHGQTRRSSVSTGGTAHTRGASPARDGAGVACGVYVRGGWMGEDWHSAERGRTGEAVGSRCRPRGEEGTRGRGEEGK